MQNTGFSEITKSRLEYQGVDPWYLEVAITGKCNFTCRYCNRFNSDLNIPLFYTMFEYFSNYKHIQITGGNPSVHPEFLNIVNICRQHCKVLGLSTNGSMCADFYLSTPIDRYSISLDDYDLDVLKRRGYESPETIIETIKIISAKKYVDVGLVVDSLNCNRIEEIIDFILSLGVSDIKLSISTKSDCLPVFTKSYEKYPILNYRVERFKKSLPMRGWPSNKCHISKNDVCIVGENHYPCLVYFREKGKAIGRLSPNMMEERIKWVEETDCTQDPICKKYCMDFKCEFNHSVV